MSEIEEPEVSIAIRISDPQCRTASSHGLSPGLPLWVSQVGKKEMFLTKKTCEEETVRRNVQKWLS